MAFTNWNIIKLIESVVNKDVEGNAFTDDEWTSMFNAHNHLLFAEKLGLPNEYSRDIPVARRGVGLSRKLISELEPFYRRETLAAPSGVADLTTLTDTYSYLLAINPASITGRGFDELNSDEIANRLGSAVTAPSVDDPAFEWSSPTSLLLYPSTITSVVVMYYKQPKDAVVVTTTNSTTLLREYDSVSSVEMEWDTEQLVEIAYRVLRDIGVNMERGDVTALAAQITRDE